MRPSAAPPGLGPGALRLGEEIEDAVRLTEAGRAFVADVSPGDWLAVHWDLACDRLAADELWQLRRWTDWQLAATNARLAAPGGEPGGALGGEPGRALGE